MSIECEHKLLIWHTPEVFSCADCKIAMAVDISRGEREQ